jgi:hypothetical protein
MKKKTPKKSKSCAISVSGQTYDRLRDVVAFSSLQKFVDGIVGTALDDPATLRRLVEKCRADP